MAKADERKRAEFLFCEKMLSQKDVATQVGVSEKTVGAWVQKYNWKQKQEANFNKTTTRVERVKDLISKLTEQNLSIMDQIQKAEKEGDSKSIIELRKESNKLSQEVAMQSKLLQQIDKDNKITLTVYMEVMEDIFRNLQKYDANLHLQTIDFQEEHLNTISMKLG